MKKKDIIFFTHLIPLPPTGGGTRSYHILKSLAETGKITLVVFTSLSNEEIKSLSLICKKILYIEAGVSLTKKKLLNKGLNGLKWLMPFLMSNYELNGRLFSLQSDKSKKFSFFKNSIFAWLYFWFKFRKPHPSEIYSVEKNIHQLQKEVNELLKGEKKILIFDFNYFLPALVCKYNVDGHTIISNSHNVEFDLLQQALKYKNNFRVNSWNKIQYRAMESAERESLALSQKVLCCSAKDKIIYESFRNTADVLIVPNGVDTHYFSIGSQPDTTFSLLFTGTMNYGPNIQGVNWFINEIFPLLLKKYPDLIFTIAGKHADKLLLNSFDNVSIISSPEDMRPYFRKACIYVVPLKQGGGTRLKIMEAAAMQKPVVSTNLGAEGLIGLNDGNILLADTKEAFANSVILLLEDKILRNRMSVNLNCWVKNYYSWNKISKEINNIVFSSN